MLLSLVVHLDGTPGSAPVGRIHCFIPLGAARRDVIVEMTVVTALVFRHAVCGGWHIGIGQAIFPCEHLGRVFAQEFQDLPVYDLLPPQDGGYPGETVRASHLFLLRHSK